jgi:hypothetical protein
VLLVLTTPLQMPIWALVLCIMIATLFLVPVGVIAAVSNTQIGLVSFGVRVVNLS